MVRFPEYVGVKLPRDIVEAARQLAAEDDRPFSTFLRRLIIEGVTRRAPAYGDKHQDESR